MQIRTGSVAAYHGRNWTSARNLTESLRWLEAGLPACDSWNNALLGGIEVICVLVHLYVPRCVRYGWIFSLHVGMQLSFRGKLKGGISPEYHRASPYGDEDGKNALLAGEMEWIFDPHTLSLKRKQGERENVYRGGMYIAIQMSCQDGALQQAESWRGGK